MPCSDWRKTMPRRMRIIALPWRCRKPPRKNGVLRHAALQEATRASAQVPQAIVRHCCRLLELADCLADHCNPNLVSDVVVATHFALAAFHGALINVRMNLASLEDADVVAEMTQALDAMIPSLLHNSRARHWKRGTRRWRCR